MRQPAPPRPEDLLCANEICRMLKISKRTFQRLREEGRLPPPVVQWNKTSMRWRRCEIETMLGPPLEASEQEAVLTTISRHINAAASSAIAAGHHATAAANAMRHLRRSSAPARDQDATNQVETSSSPAIPQPFEKEPGP